MINAEADLSLDVTPVSDPTLGPFFAPRGVVVVGASREPEKLGYALAQNLVRSGYRGAIHVVNPHGGTLFGLPLYPDVGAVPDPVDLAVLLIPAPAVPGAIQACGERGIRAVLIASGGFAETGAAGRALEAECRAVAQTYDVRLVGPNCVGWLDTHLPLNTTFLSPPGPPAGDIAFVSHSGAICAVVVDWARGQGFGLSWLISLGNQLDVSETDVLAPVAADPHTRVITLYLEGVRDGRRFVEEAARVSRGTPILALKVGRSEGGRRAAASHTGALAGQEVAYEAAFRQAGVLRVATSEDLFDGARALAWCPLPAGPHVAVLTNAGGPGVTAADAVEAHGLRLATLDEATGEALRALLPPAAGTRNPVDMLASASPEQYAESLRLLLADADVHAVLVILPPPPTYAAGAVARALIPIIQAADKPVVVALMGAPLVQEAAEYLRAARVPDYRFPERAAAALSVLARRADALAHPPDPPVRFDEVDVRAIEGLLDDAAPDADGFLSAEAATQVLAQAGVRVAGLMLATSPQAAARQARQLGFPVALKVAAAGLTHKTDVGGVRLGLADEEAVAEAFEALVAQVRQVRPEARIDGVYVQPMAPAGQEVVVGAVQDPQFGPLVMAGAGGVEVEGRHDVAFALAPLSRAEAEAVLEATWAGRKLRGFRHMPPADRDAAVEVLLRVAHLAAAVPRLAEVEINPLFVLPQGKGAVAVDARVRVA